MEPLFPEEDKSLSDLATELVASSNALAGRLHPVIQQGIGGLVRSMNCYYSNLIEGHHAHPVDIDRALAGDYSAEPEKRNLQFEARAHIDVQRKIDFGSAPQPSTSREFILWMHKGWALLREALLAGEFARGKAPELTGYQERQARTVLNTLIEKGLLVSPTSRSAVRLGFPLAVVDRWFPRLYTGPGIEA